MKALLFALIVLLQGAAPKPSFEVASIRPATAGARPRQAVEPGGRFVVTGLPLQMIIGFAYRGHEIEGGAMPGWATTSNTGVGPFARGGPLAPQTPAADDSASVSVFANIEDQLGLKVNSARATLEVTVIDSVQKPSEN